MNSFSTGSGLPLYANRAAQILTIAFAVFLSIFSFDAFSEEYSILENVFSLFVHLIPVFIILLTLLFSRKNPLVAVFVFPLLGIAYIVWAWGRFPLSVYFLIAGPLFIISFLFYLAYSCRK